MSPVAILLVAAATFGICCLIDKGYTAKFRSKVQHRSGLAVRLNKRYATFGTILTVFGLIALFTGLTDGMLLLVGGLFVMLMGIGLVIYYMTFGVFYDADSFVVTTFGKKSRTYNFRDIRTQKLYIVQGGNIIIELHLADKTAVSLQSVMEGVYPFLDHAFSAWCRQTGRNPAECTFHDPANSLWFPAEEDT